MRISFLTLFLFVLGTQTISTSDLPLRFTSEQRGLNSSKSNVRKQEALAVERCVSIKDAIRLDRKVEESKIERKYELSDVNRKAHKGKGATGGSNVNHRPNLSRNSAATLLTWTSTLVLHVSVALTFLFSLHLF